MEQEYFFTGYCRTTDKSRTVAVELDEGKLTEVDCCYPDCIHAPNCTIAESIRQLTRG